MDSAAGLLCPYSVRPQRLDAVTVELCNVLEEAGCPLAPPVQERLRWMESGGYSQFLAGAVAVHRHAVSFEERCTVLERAGRSARVLERLHPHRDHHWPALQRRARRRRVCAPFRPEGGHRDHRRPGPVR